jgi:hypothetical protein
MVVSAAGTAAERDSAQAARTALATSADGPIAKDRRVGELPFEDHYHRQAVALLSKVLVLAIGVDCAAQAHPLLGEGHNGPSMLHSAPTIVRL